MMKKILLLLIAYHLSLVSVLAKGDSVRVYTEENPLVYEDVWDLWPYAFLDDQGEPKGYNIDLIRIMMKRLDIPYTIKMKSSEEAFKDLKEGRSDLMLGLAVGYHDEYGLYGKNAVTLFTQSVLTPKSKPVEIKTFRDLGKPGMKVIVNNTSMCYHLMLDYGWGENAIPEKDIREVIQQVSAKEEGQIVWNTLTLKWLMNRYLIDNLQLTPVNMPHGEYKFMSNDQHLLDMLDEELTKLNATEQLQALQDKWFYPERQKQDAPAWIGYAMGGVGLLLLFMLVYILSYRIQNRRLTRMNDKRNRRLALILETSQVRIWTYDIQTNQFAWRNENGQVAYTYTMSEFSQRYNAEDFERLKAAIDELAGRQKTAGRDQEGEKMITLELKAKDSEGGDHELRDFNIVLSVLRRDKEGKPTVIIGTKKDITEERSRQRQDDERTLRYWSIFYTPIVGILLFNKEGRLININPKACEMFDCDPEAIIQEEPPLSAFLDTEELNLSDLNGYNTEQTTDFDHLPPQMQKIESIHRKGTVVNEFQLMTVNDDAGDLFAIFAICREKTDMLNSHEVYTQELERLNKAKAVLSEYDAGIDSITHESDVRFVTYSPQSHLLSIYRHVNEVQHTLTQTRCMTLVDDRSKKQAMRMLSVLDDCEDKDIKMVIRTTLRVKGGQQLTILFSLTPMHDKDGKIYQYEGLLRDLTDLYDTENRMAQETAKVQEVENTKNTFIKNMVQEIRTPMNTVQGYVAELDMEKPSQNEAILSQGILNNADYLLHLIDNVLYLSRLEAGMVEFHRRPSNFAELFESQCMEGWIKFQNADTRYIVENPYEQLTVDIDAENLGQAIKQIAGNAAQHTASGIVRARYDYIGRRLIISIDDTGEGIPENELARLNGEIPFATNNTKGLGLSITKELVRQMGGTIEISSERGSGTTVYIMIPCHASVIKRKKLA